MSHPLNAALILALAAAKPSDAQPLPDGIYACKVISCTHSVNAEGTPILRLDLDTAGGEFNGRRQVKNQPISVKAAGYFAALCQAAGVERTEAFIQGAIAGAETALRQFVGATLTIKRTTKGETLYIDII
jgi:hypothetical protein